MTTENISAKAPKLGTEWTGQIEIPATAEAMIQAYGDQAVRDNAWANFRVTIQSAIRRMLEAGKSPEEIQQTVSGMKMGVSLPRAAADPVSAIKSKWASMSEEDRKALLAALKNMK